MKTRLGGRTWAALLTFGLFGQIAWVIENMYFNVFLYNTISGDTSMIAAMVAWSAVTATVTTLVMGALSDRLGRRKALIVIGYLLWGVSIGAFAFIKRSPLAGAAFIMDRVMHRIGVHGKSFIPLIMGFGCNVPAIMACRTIESRSSRLITILITPFMSCSARIPIYLLLAGTFFAADAGTVMLGLYALGIVLAVVTARLMRRFLFPVDETPFVMELPPYRLPTWKTTFSHMWDKCAQYLKKMGGMILIASVIVWFLSYYPRTDAAAGTEAHYENSYLGRLGKGCEPVFSPLGFNWKAGVSLLSGLPAKEIVVSTLGVLYSEGAATAPAEQEAVIGDADGATEIIVKTDDPTPAKAFRTAEEEEEDSLSQRLLASGDFTTASALAFLVFILLYMPCIATVAAIGAEAGWKWAAASVVYNTTLAWFVAWIVYRIALIF